MSKLIEEQVVKMQFDNKGFESGVQQSMSTLDKLKAALHFKDVNMTPLEKAFSQAESTATRAGFHIRDVWLKVSEVFEYQIARKIVSSGEKIAKALTIEGAMDGFKEYELKMGSIQTIMAGTGESLATVNKYLEELNTYSDKTIYSFKDMTDNIGKFTNAGVNLDDAVNAIKGIANEAAVSGANAQEASRAMYNFSQALSAGYVKLIDWKSIENANMATKEFKSTLIEAALALGTVEKEGNDFITTTTDATGKISDAFNATKGFNDSLSHQWMTTDVLTQALKVYATDVRDLTDAEKKAYEQELKSKGFSDIQIQKFEELGIKAANAATEIKTFSMMMDTLKEAIGSGWAMTWQYIIGDFEQAKELWTSVGNAVSGVIDSMSQARNDLLKSSLSTGWERLTTMTDSAIPAVDTLRQRLTEAAVAKGMLSEERAAELEKTSDWIKSLREDGWMTKEFFEDQLHEYYDYIKSLDEESLSALSINSKDVAQFENFIKLVDKGDKEYKELLDSIYEMGGRENILEGLKNIFSGIAEILGRIGNAWAKAFGKISADDVRDLTVRFKEFSEKLHLTDGALNSIETVATLVFKTIKAGITIVTTAVKGVSKLILPLLNLADAILGVIGEIISAITNSDGIIGFADKLESGGNKIKNGYLAIMQKIADVINKIANAIRNWKDSEIFKKLSEQSARAHDALAKLWEEFKQLPIIQEMMADFEVVSNKVSNAFDALKKKIGEFFKATKSSVSLDNLNTVLTKLYHGLKNLKDIAGNVKDKIVNFFKEIKEGNSIIDSFKDNFGGVIDFFVNLKDAISDFFDKVFGDNDTSRFKELGDAIHDFFATLDGDKVTAIVLTTVFGLFAINLLRLTNAMSDAITAIGGTFNTLKMVINSYMKRQKSVLLQIAEAIVIVAGAIYVLSTIEGDKLKQALTALYAISACIGVLLIITTVVTKIANSGLSDSSKISKLAEMTFSLVALSGVLVLATFALKKISELELSKGIIKKTLSVIGVVSVLAAIAAVLARIRIPGADKGGILKTAVTLVAVAGALYIVALAMEKVHAVAQDGETLKQTANAMLKMMAGLALIALAAGSIGGFSAIGILAVVVLFEKLMPRIEKIVNYDYSNIQKGLENNKEILKSIGVMTGIMLVIGGLFGKGFSKMGTGLLKMIAVMAAMVILAKYASQLKAAEIGKGISFLESLVKMLSTMVICIGIYNLMSKMDRSQKGGIGLGAFIGIAATLGALTLIVKAVKDLDETSLNKGLKFVGALVLLVDSMFIVAGLAGKSGAASFKNLALILAGISFILGLMVTLSIIKDKKSLFTAMAAVSIVLLSLSAVFAAVSKITHESEKVPGSKKSSGTEAGTIFAVMASVAAILAGMIWLSKQPVKNIAAAAAGISVAMLAFSVVLRTLGRVYGVATASNKKRFATIFGSLLMVGAVALAIGYLADKCGDAKKMVAAGAALTIGLLAFSACVKALGHISGTTKSNMEYKQMWQALAASIYALAAVGLAIGLLSHFGGDPASIIAAATGITIGLVGVAICITAMGFACRLCEDANWKTAGVVIIGAIAAMGLVATAIGVLSSLGVDSKKLIDSAIAIGIGTIAVGAAAVLMGLAAKIAGDADLKNAAVVLGMAIVGLVAVAVAMYELGSRLSPEQTESIAAMAPSFALIMTALGVMCIEMAAAGRIAKGANIGGMVTALIGSIVGLAAIVAAAIGLGYLFESDFLNGKTEELLDRGLDALVRIFTKVGEALGGLVGGFLGTMIGELVAGVGAGLNILMDDWHLGGFFKKVAAVPQEAIDGAKNVAAVIGAWIGVGWDQFWATFWGADIDFEKLNFDMIGQMIVAFANSVKGISDDDLKKANLAASIGASIATLADNLPTSGGFLEIFTGKKESLQEFGAGLVSFATGIISFAVAARGITDDDVDNVNRAITAADIVSQFSKTLQSYGGLKGIIFGDKQTISEFGDSIVAFIESLMKFVEKARELENKGGDYPTLIQKVSDSVQPLNELSKNLDRVGGLFAKVVGHSDLRTFSDTFVPFAENLYDFVKYVNSNLNWDYEGLIVKVTDAVDPLANLAAKLAEKKETFLGIGTLEIDEFGAQIKKFGNKLADFCKDNKGVDYSPIYNIAGFIDPLLSLADLGSKVNANGIQSVIDSLNSIAKVSLENVSTAFANDTTAMSSIVQLVTNMKNTLVTQSPTATDKFREFGVELTQSVKTGIENGIVLYAETAVSSMIKAIKNKLTQLTATNIFETYGKNVAIGLANGIDTEADRAIKSAERLANAVANTTKSGLKENSPSKLSMQFGEYWDEGLANGISRGTGNVVKTVDVLSDDVISSTKSILTGISNVLDTNMDFQPTIRPVMDTSDISEKSEEINRMLSMNNEIANKTSLSFNSSDLALARNVSNSFKPRNAEVQSVEKAANDSNKATNSTANQPNNTQVNVVLEGDAAGIFRLVRQENKKFVKSTGYAPLGARI